MGPWGFWLLWSGPTGKMDVSTHPLLNTVPVFRNREPYRSGSSGYRTQDRRVEEGTYQQCGAHRSLAGFLVSHLAFTCNRPREEGGTERKATPPMFRGQAWDPWACPFPLPTTPRPSSQGDLSCLLAQVPRSTPVSQPAPPWPAHAFTMLPATSQDACAREADLPSARGQAAWESRGPGNRRRVTFTHLRLSLDPFHFPQFPPPLPQTSTYPFCFFGFSSFWTNDWIWRWALSPWSVCKWWEWTSWKESQTVSISLGRNHI